jgi:hypothetical protein
MREAEIVCMHIIRDVVNEKDRIDARVPMDSRRGSYLLLLLPHMVQYLCFHHRRDSPFHIKMLHLCKECISPNNNILAGLVHHITTAVKRVEERKPRLRSDNAAHRTIAWDQIWLFPSFYEVTFGSILLGSHQPTALA